MIKTGNRSASIKSAELSMISVRGELDLFAGLLILPAARARAAVAGREKSDVSNAKKPLFRSRIDHTFKL